MSSRKASIIWLIAVVLVAAAALSGAHPAAAAPSPPAAASANIPAAAVALPESAVQPGVLPSTLRAAGLRNQPAHAKSSAECTNYSERCLKRASKNVVYAQRECLMCHNWCWAAIQSAELHQEADQDRWFEVIGSCEKSIKSMRKRRK